MNCGKPGALASGGAVRSQAAVIRAERPLSRLPAGIGPSGPWSPALLLAASPPPCSAWPDHRLSARSNRSSHRRRPESLLPGSCARSSGWQ
jgi:hypothetical protein